MTTVYSPAGADVTNISTSAKFPYLTEAFGSDGSRWVYGEATAAITQGMAVAITSGGQATALTKALADAGNIIAFYQGSTDLADGDFTWFLTKGGTDTHYVKAKNGCAINVALYTTGSAGYLDDTAASQTLVGGVILLDTATSSGAIEEAFVFATARADATA